MNTNIETTATHASVAVTDGSFATTVLQSTQPVLVDFWAPWCGPCRMIAPVIEELAREFAGRATVAKMNVDENPETLTRLNISGIPALLVFKNGQVVERITGLTSKKALATKLAAHLN